MIMMYRQLSWKVALLALLFAVPSAVFASEYNLVLTLSHVIATNQITYASLHLAKGTAHVNAFQPEDGYTLTLLSPSRQSLFVTHFLPPGPELDSDVQSKEVPFTFTIPYLLDASSIQVTDPGKKPIFSIPVPPLEKLVDDALDMTLSAKESNIATLIPPPQPPVPPKKDDTKIWTDRLPKDSTLIAGISGIAGLLVLLGAFVTYRRKRSTKSL